MRKGRSTDYSSANSANGRRVSRRRFMRDLTALSVTALAGPT